jgi:hypothetical protein
MTNIMNMTDIKVLELANSTTADFALKENLGYDAIKSIVTRYIGKKCAQNTVDYLEVLEINDSSCQKYLKNFLVVVRTQVAGETHILALQHRKKPIFLNMASQLGKMFRGFLNVTKEVFDHQMKTESKTEVEDRTEIKEWMR